jgi:transmembrane secretion effector
MGWLGGFRSRYLKGPLWSHRDFLKLWTGETISLVGDQFTGLAVPFIATFIILATVPPEAAALPLSILFASLTAPFLLFGLVVGVWVDRHRPRRIMMTADAGRMVLVALVPLAAVFNFLSMPLLYFVGFFHGVFTVFFDVAYQSYIPALVERNQIVDANGKLETTRAISGTFGPGLAGISIRLIYAPFVMIFDSLSFLASFLFLSRIRRGEVKPTRVEGSTLLKEAREGISVVFGNKMLRSIAGCTGTLNFFGNATGALLLLLIRNNLGFSKVDAPLLLGFLGIIGGIGGVVGALYASRIAGRIGVGWAIVVAALISGGSNLGVAVATHSNAAYLFGFTQFLGGMTGNLYNINQVSFRQAIVPLRLQGRMNATMRFIVWGTLPIGAIVGGLMGGALGIYPAIVLTAIGGLLGFLWVFLSPVRGLKVIPEPVA